MSNFHYKVYTNINEISEVQWRNCFSTSSFTNYHFLSSLELSGSVSVQTGWQPYHIAIFQKDKLVALLPGYVKSHSYGEYVFDWAWAEAYERYQLDYYPKWICAVPFTPVSETRIGLKNTTDKAIYPFIKSLLNTLAEEHAWSGWHINFCLKDELQQLECAQVNARRGVQFSWHNRQYQSFSQYLDKLTARKRKSIKKERNKASAQVDSINVLQSDQITEQIITQFYQFYCATYLKRSGHHGYLNLNFFKLLLDKMQDNLVLTAAFKDHEMVAASLFVKGQKSLFGRYWGAFEEFDSLHFELCYYQGIEYCIEHQLDYFNAGAQGEHKILRGFEPEYTYSCHHIRNEMFQPAIANFLKHEWQQIADYKAQCDSLLPFNKLQ